MGIDVYLRWNAQTEEDKNKQMRCGFSTVSGDVGYLREAYHGGPYATHILVREAFESGDGTAEIPAATMRERLTNVTEPARGKILYATDIVAAEIMRLLESAGPAVAVTGRHAGYAPTEPQTVAECVRARYARVYPDATAADVADALQAFYDFVALAETKEQELGRPCTVVASY